MKKTLLIALLAMAALGFVVGCTMTKTNGTLLKCPACGYEFTAPAGS